MSNVDTKTKEELSTEEYLVAFIDVLGAADKIKNALAKELYRMV